MLKLALVFVGSGLGGVLRYGLSGLVQGWSGSTFPLGTMAINVSGCLVMGFLAAAWSGPVFGRDELRTAVLIGLLGGYTTFSAFGLDFQTLAQQGQWARASLYVSGSVVLSLAAVWLGAIAAGRLCGPAGPMP